MRIDPPAGSIVLTLDAPAFPMRPPVVRHRDLIPPDILQAVAPRWNTPHFGPSQVHFVRLRDVFVVKEGLVFDAAGRLFSNSITQHSEDEIAHGSALVAMARDRAPRHAGPWVLCKKRGEANYGHWLIEMLPKMFLAERYLGVAGLRYVVPAADGGLARVIAGCAERLGVEAGRRLALDGMPAFFDDLIVVDGLTSHGMFMSPLVVPALDAVAARVPPGPAGKLLVMRTGHREIANAAAVQRAAAAAGYAAVDPGRLPLAQQIACFKGARDIVGIMGAAMSNIGFATGARVVNLAPAGMPDTFYWFLAGLRGLDYREIRCRQVGPVRGNAPWDTDIAVDEADFGEIFRADAPRMAAQ